MSAEDLRNAAIHGKHQLVCSVLKDRANNCSADEFGLTSLMYSCWNGHIECVKYLACNPMGVDATGTRRSCIDMVSNKGYTALHLAALDAPDTKNAAFEITTILLLLGADRTIRCRDGFTAYEIAKKLNRSTVMKAFHEYDHQEEDMGIKMEVDDLRRNLKSKYTFRTELRMEVDPADFAKATFAVPNFLFEHQREGYIPPELRIRESQIAPLVDEGFNYKEGTDSLHCLQFALQQAEVSQSRREVLLTRGNDGWQRPVVADPLFTPKVRRRGKRGNHTLKPAADAAAAGTTPAAGAATATTAAPSASGSGTPAAPPSPKKASNANSSSSSSSATAKAVGKNSPYAAAPSPSKGKK